MPKHVYKKGTDKKLTEVGILPSLTEWDGKSNVGHTHAISDVTNLQTSLNGKLEFHNQFYGNIEKDGIKVYGKTNINDQVGKDYSNGNIIYSAFGHQKYNTPSYVQSGYYTTIDGVFNTGYGTIIGRGKFTPSGNADDTNTADYIKGILITPTSEAFIYNSAKDDAYSFDTRLATQSDISGLQSSINGKQATLVSGTNIKTINGNSILGSGNLSINASLPNNSDVTLRTLSFKGGSNYSISGIYVIETDAVSLSGSVGSNASINFSIESYYYSDYPNGRWYYVATPTSGGYIDTIAVGVEATTSGGGGGKVWIRRVSSGSTQNYKVTVYCIRQY